MKAADLAFAAKQSVMSESVEIPLTYVKFAVLIESNDISAVNNLLRHLMRTKSTAFLNDMATYCLNKGHFRLSAALYGGLYAKIGKHPTNTNDKFLKNQLDFRYGRYEMAITGLVALIRIEKNPNTLVEEKLALGGMYNQLYMYEAALEVTKDFDQNSLKTGEIRYEALMGLDKVKEAKALLNAVIAANDSKSLPDNISRLKLAQLLVYAGKTNEAIAIVEPLLNDPLLSGNCMSVLFNCYRTNDNLAKMAELVVSSREQGFNRLSFSIDSYLANSELVIESKAEHPSEQKLQDLNERIAKDGAGLQDSINDEKQSFSGILTFIDSLENLLNSTGYLPEEKFPDVGKLIPKSASRLIDVLKSYYMLGKMHQAAARLEPQLMEGVSFSYSPLSSYDGSGGENSSPILNTLETLNLRSNKYYVQDPAVLLEGLETYAKGLGQADIKNLGPRDAIYLLARYTEEIVKSSGEPSIADDNNSSLEDKIKQGDFNQGVCRHYTSIFLQLFSALKAVDPKLSGNFAVPDYSPSHTFPTILNVKNNQVRLTSIEPFWDDSTPEFGDKLEAEPIKHFALINIMKREMAQGHYQQALKIVEKQIAVAHDVATKLELSVLQLSIQDVMSATIESRQKTIADLLEIEKALSTQADRKVAADLLPLVQFLLGKQYLRVGEYQKSLEYLRKLNPENVGSGTFDEVQDLVNRCLFALGKTDEVQSNIAQIVKTGKPFTLVGKISDQHGNNPYSGVSPSGENENANSDLYVSDPSFIYLPPNASIWIDIDGAKTLLKAENGVIKLPKAVSISCRQSTLIELLLTVELH